MKIERKFANANKWTFTILPIKQLLYRYIPAGSGWIDPFAGMNSPAEFTNDMNPKMPTKYHMDAKDFVEMLQGEYEGILFDPPYSVRQITECYEGFGIKATSLDTSNNFYNRVMNIACNKIKMGGFAISFGWNSNGFGKTRGFDLIEILLVAHGGHANDTIVTVEKKNRHINKLF